MMDLTLVKSQLRIDHDDEDALIQSYIDAAVAHIEMHCDRKLVSGEPTSEGEMGMTSDVQQALLLLVGHWYANREAVVVGQTSNQVPLAFERLLWYRKRF